MDKAKHFVLSEMTTQVRFGDITQSITLSFPISGSQIKDKVADLFGLEPNKFRLERDGKYLPPLSSYSVWLCSPLTVVLVEELSKTYYSVYTNNFKLFFALMEENRTRTCIECSRREVLDLLRQKYYYQFARLLVSKIEPTEILSKVTRDLEPLSQEWKYSGLHLALVLAEYHSDLRPHVLSLLESTPMSSFTPIGHIVFGQDQSWTLPVLLTVPKDWVCPYGDDLFTMAVRNKAVKCLESLLQYQISFDWNTTLHLAVEHSAECLAILLENGIEFSTLPSFRSITQNTKALSSFLTYCRQGRKKFVEALVKRIKNGKVISRELLHYFSPYLGKHHLKNSCPETLLNACETSLWRFVQHESIFEQKPSNIQENLVDILTLEEIPKESLVVLDKYYFSRGFLNVYLERKSKSVDPVLNPFTNLPLTNRDLLVLRSQKVNVLRKLLFKL